MSDTLSQEAKRRVGLKAASMLEGGMVLGLGTGSTAACAIEEIGRRVREEGLNVAGVPTSFSAAILARQAGIQVKTLAEVDRVDLALDGADEVAPNRDLIKGRGAAHVQEKIVEAFAERFVVLVDDSKLVGQIGEKCAVPVEVLPIAMPLVERELRKLGAEPVLRVGTGKDGPVVSDQGNFIVDAGFGAIALPGDVALSLDQIPGVVGHGLFIGMADEVLVGNREDGSIKSL